MSQTGRKGRQSEMFEIGLGYRRLVVRGNSAGFRPGGPILCKSYVFGDIGQTRVKIKGWVIRLVFIREGRFCVKIMYSVTSAKLE